MNSVISVIGFVAAMLSAIILVPQLFKTVRTKKTRNLSSATFLILMASSTLWFVYGLYTHTWPLIASSLCGLLSAIIMLDLKAHYG